ncbi:Transcriptional regulator WAR1 [Lachnellula suecica]|uniref:Transcriptional regulator WAR1 n=1 Tax=Lachnellula suecica TaxID=602035 RepID=A0A8T9C2Q0_9HELO|nr:Transcriptional regulator WAR1 [Lachnellula suecica]
MQSQIPVNVPDSNQRTPLQACNPPLASRPAPQSTQSYLQFNDNSTQGQDEALQIFREQYAVRFPFIVIPPQLTSSELRAQSPFLHRTIMLVALQNQRLKQIEMSKQVSMEIAAALILRGERSLDMLQAVIIYNTWSYYYSPVVPHTQSTAMFQLSFALLFDLGLNRPVRDAEGPEMLVDPSKNVTEINSKEGKRTLDERRAFLSCYILTSVIALYIKKTDGIPYSPYMDYCCKVLEEKAECGSDLLLVALAKLQFVAESFQRNVLQKSRNTELKVPAWMYVKSLRNELETLWASFSPSLRQNQFLIMNYHSTEIFLYEPCLQQHPIAIGFTMGDPQRIDMLHACFVSAKSLLDIFLGQPLSVYSSITVLELSHIGQGLVTFFKLSMVDEPGWDLAYVRKIIGAGEYWDRLISNFEQVGAVIDQSQPEPCRNSFPTGCSNAMRKIKGVYEAKIAAETAQNVSDEQAVSLGLDAMIYGDQIDWMDDVYWEEMLNDGNFLQQ